MDDMSVDKMRDVVDKLRKGESVQSTRGPVVQGFRASERAIAGMDDGLADSGSNNADAVMLRGLTVAKEQGMPAVDGGGK
jgi:NADH-quinone oxidoreductase subunit E